MEMQLEQPLKIDVTAAVSAARSYFQTLENMKMMGDQIVDVRLEEVELSENRQFWLITLGFNRQRDQAKNPLGMAGIPQYEREYKIFKINSETGIVESMKIRVV